MVSRTSPLQHFTGKVDVSLWVKIRTDWTIKKAIKICQHQSNCNTKTFKGRMLKSIRHHYSFKILKPLSSHLCTVATTIKTTATFEKIDHFNSGRICISKINTSRNHQWNKAHCCNNLFNGVHVRDAKSKLDRNHYGKNTNNWQNYLNSVCVISIVVKYVSMISIWFVNVSFYYIILSGSIYK